MSTGCDNLAYQFVTRSTDLVMDCPIFFQLQIALGTNMSMVSNTKMDINVSFTEFMCIIWSTVVVIFGLIAILKLKPGMNSLKIQTGRGNQKLWFKEGETMKYLQLSFSIVSWIKLILLFIITTNGSDTSFIT
jgi:hypothetical protein